jgi:excisionase family DNA binding protein
MEKLLLTAEEVGQLLGLSRAKVYTLIMRAEIESVTIGKNRRVPRDAVRDYVERLRRDGTAA